MPLHSSPLLHNWSKVDESRCSESQVSPWRSTSEAFFAPKFPIGDKSALVLVMAWCRQATSHYPSQCWARLVFCTNADPIPWRLTVICMTRHQRAIGTKDISRQLQFFVNPMRNFGLLVAWAKQGIRWALKSCPTCSHDWQSKPVTKKPDRPAPVKHVNVWPVSVNCRAT